VLERSASSISDEIKRNSVNEIYSAKKANHKSRVRRSNAKFQGMNIVNNKVLRKEVDTLLYDDVSPGNVSGRVKLKFGVSISKDSIYRYIKSIYGRKIEHHRKSIKYKNRSKVKLTKLRDRVNISKRPKIVDNRTRYGHAEADFIVSGKAGTGILLVVVDRKVRKVWIRKITKVTIENVHTCFLSIQKEYINMKTLTLDNDILFRKHKLLKDLLKVRIYFCNPYHSWEKGTVENTNKYIRRYIKKSSDISLYSNEYIQNIQDKLNRRPMECLQYKTPEEEHLKYLKRIQSKKKR
jgi:IS30 family transposase